MMFQNKKVVMAGNQAAFHAEATDWEADRIASKDKSERRAWIVAGAAVTVAIAAVIGFASLAPYKRVVPYVFTVDRATGNVELVSAADDRTVVGYQELLDKHWAQKYIVARESYNYKLLQNDYDTVLSLSADDVAREYAKAYDGPNARDKKYGTSIEMRVKVLSVTLAQDEIGTKTVVRFEKTSKRSEADNADAPQYYVATMAFEYKPSMFGKERELIQNPLGYKVTSYRIDSEIAPVAGTNGATPK